MKHKSTSKNSKPKKHQTTKNSNQENSNNEDKNRGLSNPKISAAIAGILLLAMLVTAAISSAGTARAGEEPTTESASARTGSLQLAKEYIYAGSRMPAIEDYGISATPTLTPTAAPTPTTPSSAPTLDVRSQTQIDVYWNASPAGENVTSYNLRINGTHLLTGIIYTSFPATSLVPNTTYTFEVAAVNSSGASSPWSQSASATTLSNAPAPSVPTGVYAQTYSSTQINVYWDASPPSENVTGYNLRIDGSQVFSGITYTSFPVTGFAPGTTHSFEVQAVNSSGGISGRSSPVSATTASAPTIPTVTATDVISSTQINVYWSAAQAGENVAGYNVRINGSQIITGITYTSFPFTDLSPNTTYTFEVQAVDAAGGASGWSPSASATTAP